MKSLINARKEFVAIGTAPSTTSGSNDACQVIYKEFGVSSRARLKRGISIGDLVAKYETEPAIAARFAKARQQIEPALRESGNVLRGLRLAAGLSQAKVAELAGTSQAYIARMEAASVDPGTDMIERVSKALGLDPLVLFKAIRNQRDKLESE